jgi:hypothetical protein
VKSVTAANYVRAVESTVTTEPSIASESTVASESTTAPEIVAIEEATAAETMEPRPGADENSAGEKLWTVEPIRRATVGVIPVVAISAYWRWTNIARLNSNSNRHLRVCATN